ncbi:GyrI-like domain-containing protein [Salinibacterium sp. SWN1162]|uniref:GyrI-like domain-containing protein n=1 Tax=Salinibacterium sp. SWN1162 TaxID=2792053 RepID=UPI0018CD2896|nr:GyrI-like domain-containing protein [Salinibacterium sp. SWN1162]MBH0010097.1 GyrI-like domain-containing protein [Salinibacterium sp. SWN1162]
MSPKITVETVATQLVAGLDFATTTATLPADMAAAIDDLRAHTAEAQLATTGPIIAVYAEEMRPNLPWTCEVCVPVAEAFVEHPTLRSHELPGGVVATATHAGSYTDLKSTYSAIFDWFAEHGHTYAGAPREIYLNSPADVAEDQLLTRIEFPVVLASF